MMNVLKNTSKIKWINITNMMNYINTMSRKIYMDIMKVVNYLILLPIFGEPISCTYFTGIFKNQVRLENARLILCAKQRIHVSSFGK